MATLSCDQCEARLPSYSLHALDRQETTEVAEHLSTCPRCPASLAAYEAVLDRLGQAVPQHDPPEELQQRLQAALRPSTSLGPPTAVPSRPRWWHIWTPRRALAVMVANVVLFLGTAWWAWQVWSAAVSSGSALPQVTPTSQRQVFTLLVAPEMRRVFLRSDKTESHAHGVLLLQPDDPQAVLMVQDLPPLRQNRVYQLWLVYGDQQRDNGGTFQVGAGGVGILHVTAPRPLATYRAVGITEEPVGGSPGPTSPRVIGGSL
jgi:hypothetical protein